MFDGIDTTVQLFYVGRESWPAFAERVRPHLEKMADGSGGRFDADDIHAAISVGRMQLWLVLFGSEILCAIVTEIIEYPQLRALRMVGIVGRNSRRWVDLLAKMECAARTVFGCKMMEALHQPGHERLLVTDGWRTYHILSDKTL
jgi:hypothetical protein